MTDRPFAFPAAAATTASRQPWILMWALAAAIFMGCKWLSWREGAAALERVPVARSFAYLFLWPGMDAKSFLDPGRPSRSPAASEWLFAAAKTLAGAALLWGLARCVPAAHPLLAGWTGMAGLIFLLHFGTFHLASLFWRTAGIPAEPIMRMPIAARSLGEFWSFRWNRGFNDLAHRHVFQPARRALGIPGATLLTFLASGLVHDLVISIPARADYGLPTLYFLLQGTGVLAERSPFGRRAGLRRGIRGRLFALTIAAAPAFWLFIRPSSRGSSSHSCTPSKHYEHARTSPSARRDSSIHDSDRQRACAARARLARQSRPASSLSSPSLLGL